MLDTLWLSDDGLLCNAVTRHSKMARNTLPHGKLLAHGVGSQPLAHSESDASFIFSTHNISTTHIHEDGCNAGPAPRCYLRQSP
jgi:hypothetical protein